MKAQHLAAAGTLAQGLLEGPRYNLLMLVVGVAGVLAAIVVPLYSARRRSRLGRNPRILLPVDNAHAGEDVTFVAAGFKRFELVNIFFTNHHRSAKVPSFKRLGVVEAQADSKGGISEEITVPMNLPIGENLIVVERQDPSLDPTETAARFYVLVRRTERQGI